MSDFPDVTQSGITSDATKGAFKSANNLGHLPTGGATSAGTSGLLRKAQVFSVRHSTKGMRPVGAPKLRPIENLGKSIGRKRGY